MTSDERLARFITKVCRYRLHLVEAERFHPLNESEKAWLEAARRN